MSTLAIPPKRVRLYRVLWDRWIIVLRILLDLGAGSHPVKWRAVADTLLVDKKTVQKYIAGLVRDGHITTAGDGVMLTQSGMSALLENEQGGEFLPSSGEKIPEKNSQLLESVVVEVNPESILTTTPTESGKNLGEKISPQADRIEAFFDAEVQTVLDHADILFDGSDISRKGLPHYLHIEKVLGWLAYAYDKRALLHSPCGLVYSKLKDPAAPMPSMKYMRNPLAFFPDPYLSAIGKYHKVCDRCEQEFTDFEAYEAHREPCLMTPLQETEEEEAPTEPFSLDADDTVTEAVRSAWNAVLTTLRNEMPSASFDTWVRDTSPMHADPEGLHIGVRNAYARDWLDSRLKPTIERMVGRTVTFVVAAETEEG